MARIGLGLLATAGAQWPVGGQEPGPAGKRLVGAKRAAPVGVVVRVDLSDQAAGSRPAILLAGSILEARIAGEAGAAVTWALAYEQTVLAHGQVMLDRSGAGRVRLTLPDVRHRAACQLALKAAGSVVRRKVIVYPAALLSHAARRVADLEIAVVDQTGRTQRSLAAEGIDHESLDSQISRDFTASRTVILAGFRRAEELSEVCRRFQRRVEGGVSLVILNPPTRWVGWGVNMARPENAVGGAARFAPGLGRLIPAADLGSGPWEATLQTGGGAVPLVWCGSRRPGRDNRKLAVARHTLVTACPAAKGWVIVSTLPQTRNPNTNAVGRGVLGELILWLIEPAPARRQPSKETDHVQSKPLEMDDRRSADGNGGK